MLFKLLGYTTFANVDLAASKVDRVEGVLIATPTHSHAQLAKWAISKGVPCFIEKPLTLDFNASNELRALASANKGVPVQVGFVLRYVASFLRLRQLVQSNSLGLMLGYTASMRGNVILKPPSTESWQGNFKNGGGCLNEYGPHIIDLCRFIFGPVERVDDVQMEQVFCTHADDKIDFSFFHSNGSTGKVEVDWCDTTKRKSVVEFKVKFEFAEVRVDNSTVEISWNEDCRMCHERRLEIDAPIRPFNVAYYLRGEEFSLELEEFLGACVGRRLSVDNALPVDTTARLEDGCEVDRLIDEIARKAGLK
jgi:predicted dehydrogenase